MPLVDGAPPDETGVRPDDATLVAAALRADRTATRVIWDRYAPLAVGLLRRFFGTAADQDDLVQEVFLRVFRRLGELRHPDALRGFIVGIALGVARNEARKNKVRAIVGLSAEVDRLAAPIGPDAEAREAARRLYAILDRSSAEDRSLFVSRYVEEMELQEVAAAHGMSFATARRRIDRMTDRMSKRLRGDELLARYADGFLKKGAASP
jgi:RNA polymerase sigma-70 factor (ECF subfamily)